MSATDATFQNGDVVNGLDGTDRLNLTIADGNTPAGAEVNGVEQVFARNVSESASEVSAASISGVEQLWNRNSIADSDVNFTSVGSNATLGVLNTGTNTEIGFTSTVLSGKDDTVNVALDQAAGGNVTIGDGAETLSVNSGGSEANKLGTVDGGTAATLTLTGDQDLMIGGTDNSVETVDASGFGGALTATLSTAGTSNDVTVTGSAQDDSFTFGTLDEDDTIDGGDGEDTLSIVGDFDGVNLSNVENVNVKATSTTVTIDADKAQSVTEFAVDAAGFAVDTLEITNLAEGTSVTLNSNSDLTISGNNFSLDADEDGGGSDALSLNFAGNGAFTINTTALTTNEVEEFNIDVGQGGLTLNIADALNLGSATLEEVTFTGSGAS